MEEMQKPGRSFLFFVTLLDHQPSMGFGITVCIYTSC